MNVETLAVVSPWFAGAHGDDYPIWSRMYGQTIDAIMRGYREFLAVQHAVPAGKPRIRVVAVGIGGWEGPMLRLEVPALRE